MKFCNAKYRGFLLAATLSMVVEYLMGLADSVIAGHLVGETALAGVNLLQTPMNTITFVAALFGTGTSVCFSVAMGRSDRDGATRIFSQGVWCCLFAGMLMVATMFFGRDAFLDVFGAAPEVRAMAVAYWNWFIPCALLEPVVFLVSSACYADGDTRVCMVAYAVQFLGNCIGSIPLTMTMGISGTALGTVLGHLGAAAVLAFHFFRPANTLRLAWHFKWKEVAYIVRTSFGDACVRLCWALLFFLLSRYVVAHFGSERLSVLAAVLAVLGIAEAFNGPPNAAQPLVGVYVGEGNEVGVRTVMVTALRTVLVASIALTAILLAFPGLAVKLVGIDEPELVAASRTAVRLVAGGMCGNALVMLFNSYFVFVERGGLACLLTVLANFVVPVALYPVLGSAFGEVGLWAALGIAPVVSCVLFAVLLLVRFGRAGFPWLLDSEREKQLRVFDLELVPERICAVSAEVGALLRGRGIAAATASRVALLVEETFMAVKDRNGAKRVLAEATLDFSNGVSLVLRDDGEIFDITDADARISSLRSYLVASLMEKQPNRCNLITTGFNRNVFRFPTGER